MGQTSYYVTFCMGLGVDDFSRFLTTTFLDTFANIGALVYKPNIVFKVHEGVNRFPTNESGNGCGYGLAVFDERDKEALHVFRVVGFYG